LIDYKGVVERIKQVRGDMNQRSFAQKVGINPTYLSNIENHRTKPSIDCLSAISLECDVSLDWLTGGTSKSAHGAIIKSKGVNVLENYGSISTNDADGKEPVGTDDKVLDRLCLLVIENNDMKKKIAESEAIELENRELKAKLRSIQEGP